MKHVRLVFIASAITAILMCGTAQAEPVKSFCGIGVQLDTAKDLFKVEKLISGGGAEDAGLAVGSLITHVDGKPIKGMELDKVVNLIRGPEHSVVKLTFIGDLGRTRTIEIKRTKFSGPETFEGVYYCAHDPSVVITISRTRGRQFAIRCPEEHWDGVGLLSDNYYKGVFRMADSPEIHKNFRGAIGFHRIDFLFGGQLRLQSKFNFHDSDEKMIEKTLIREPEKTE